MPILSSHPVRLDAIVAMFRYHVSAGRYWRSKGDETRMTAHLQNARQCLRMARQTASSK